MARAVEQHTQRKPADRAVIAETAQMPDSASTRKCLNKAHPLRESTIETLEEVIVADRREFGRVVSRSGFAQEAVLTAAKQARMRFGRGREGQL